MEPARTLLDWADAFTTTLARLAERICVDCVATALPAKTEVDAVRAMLTGQVA
jgi:hypothetical protein